MNRMADEPTATRREALTPAEVAELEQALKRCSPATLAAACRFRSTGDVEHLRPVIAGVLERYVERDLRPRLQNSDDSLRLIEDLGIDSLTMLEVVLLTEDILQISVSNEELKQLRTLGDIRQFLTRKVDSAP